MKESFTPLMRQYLRLKEESKDAILLFRLGDFYEMFFEDAHTASRLLQITLTSREAGKGRCVPMAGIPYHAAETYIARLVRAGLKVAICEQVEKPGKGKKLLRREITRIISPGTVIEDTLLEAKANNYLAAVCGEGKRFGLAYLDLSTGEFRATEIEGERELADELARIAPAELLVPEGFLRPAGIWQVTVAPLENFSLTKARRALCEHFGIEDVRGFEWEKYPIATGAAGALVQYLNQTQKRHIAHLDRLTIYQVGDYLLLDERTQANLELLKSQAGDRRASLYGVLDFTCTGMGGRTLRQWIMQPLCNVKAIRQRQSAVEEFLQEEILRARCRELLEKIADMERLLGRVGYGSANARDMVALRESLKVIPQIKGIIKELSADYNKEILEDLGDVGDIVELLEKALMDDPPATLHDGGIIRDGYDSELDSLRAIRRDGKAWLAQFQKKEIQRTGIPSLKVGYNKVFGYYIEVTKPHLSRIPQDYQRKQTLVNAERFITQELKDFEARVLGAEERIRELEYEIFCRLREEVAQRAEQLKRIARALGRLDTVCALAEAAARYNYIKPEVDEEEGIQIEEGRHPVVERQVEDFVPNSVLVDTEDNRFLIITGPNMAGKSTFIRQVALITLMAQMGSFVPAKSARIGVVDRIFTRIGAGEDIAGGMSTFMVEMRETANILHNATGRSLIILDEIGRGTSTYDGMSIAWAVAEFIHEKIRARTLFATHYHELTELAEQLRGVKNYNMAVREWEGRVVFLHKVVPGGADRSYGIHVAEIAGFPQEVIKRAWEILASLEAESMKEHKERKGKRETQLSLFEEIEHPVVGKLRKIDVERITPLEALMKIAELKRMVEDGKDLGTSS